MNAGVDRIEDRRLATLSAVVTRVRQTTGSRQGVLRLPAVMLITCTACLVLPISDGHGSEQASLQPQPSAAAPAAGAGSTAAPPSEPAELDRLRISSQTWRRGGLGSKALVTFTLRNDNDYAVKDVEILCSFSRRDGRHLTDRRRTLPDTVGMKSRKTFARVPVGFVNVNAGRAECSLAAAQRD